MAWHLALALAVPLSAMGATAAPAGRLLFLDLDHHLTVSPPDGRGGRRLTAEGLGKKDTISVLAAGRKYAIFHPKSTERTVVTLYDMASGRPEFSQEVPANSFIVGPIFGDPDLFLLRAVIGSSDGNKAFVVNLRSGRLLSALATQGLHHDIEVLPDGRLYGIEPKTGRIAVAGADGVWRDVGALQVPPNLEIAQWRLSHRGDKLAVVYGRMNEIKLLKSDIWIANLDGSGQYRLTHQWDMLGPHWSPDDRHVAFQFDTSSWLANPAGLGGAGVYGHCSYWAAPVEARDVADVSYKRPHPVATQLFVDKDGIAMNDVCRILDWLP